MWRLAFICGVIIGAICGWKIYAPEKPYALDYNRMGINPLIMYSKFLDDYTYPLGEKYLSEDMGMVLSKFGVDARVYAIENTYGNENFRAGYELYLRGFPELQLSQYHNYFDADKIAVLFESIPYKIEEVKNADVVFTGSLQKSREYQAMGINAHFLPQFTRLDKFYNAPREGLHNELLFVGNRYPDKPYRKSIEYSLEYGYNLAVYGAGWENILTGDKANLYKAKQIKGDSLKYFYSSADIVLNDTRDDMVEAGFISNRIFDVTACGGFIISDYIPEIEEIYGDNIPMYKTKEDFKELVDYYMAHPEERREKALKAQKITRERFGAETVMMEMMRILEKYRMEKGIGQ